MNDELGEIIANLRHLIEKHTTVIKERQRIINAYQRAIEALQVEPKPEPKALQPEPKALQPEKEPTNTNTVPKKALQPEKEPTNTNTNTNTVPKKALQPEKEPKALQPGDWTEKHYRQWLQEHPVRLTRPVEQTAIELDVPVPLVYQWRKALIGMATDSGGNDNGNGRLPFSDELELYQHFRKYPDDLHLPVPKLARKIQSVPSVVYKWIKRLIDAEFIEVVGIGFRGKRDLRLLEP